jgi:hypothetical protein
LLGLNPFISLLLNGFRRLQDRLSAPIKIPGCSEVRSLSNGSDHKNDITSGASPTSISSKQPPPSTFCIEWPIDNWENAPKEIKLTGSHWNWKEQVSMDRSQNGFIYPLELSEEFIANVKQPFVFKFVLDGEWKICPTLPKHVDENGIENNFLSFGTYYKS